PPAQGPGLVCPGLLGYDNPAMNRMTQLSLDNPFGKPIYHIDETTSTMDEARRLVAQAAGSGLQGNSPDAASLHGAVVVADYQSAGRGRAAGRVWHAVSGESLLCTLILSYERFQDIPAALPLRLGVAVALTLEELWPRLAGRIRIKWPNDVLIDGKKVCGILCEGEGTFVYAGMGINLLQEDFPVELRHRSVSVLQALEHTGGDWAKPDRYRLLINLLDTIQTLLKDGTGTGEDGAICGADSGQSRLAPWHQELEERLYKRGERVRFLSGSTDAPSEVLGILEGVAPTGELLIRPIGSSRTERFITGELDVYSRSD
ncbi:MAG TPA: biotin--[acetyl-CoA-carboxylase] ligase, partial [Treponema sp.]|nr:biotin--[acetyl-CoA-carboxylase] ligase [Treponema sp.]